MRLRSASSSNQLGVTQGSWEETIFRVEQWQGKGTEPSTGHQGEEHIQGSGSVVAHSCSEVRVWRGESGHQLRRGIIGIR